MRLPNLEEALRSGGHSAASWLEGANEFGTGGFIITDPSYQEFVAEVMPQAANYTVLWCYFAKEINGDIAYDPLVKYRVTIGSDEHLEFDPFYYESWPWGPFQVKEAESNRMRPIISKQDLEQYAKDFDDEFRLRGWIGKVAHARKEVIEAATQQLL